MSDLGEETLFEFREAFDLLDEDGDMTIGVHELDSSLRSLGRPLKADQLRSVLDRVDSGRSGAIEFPEFVQSLIHNTHSDVLEELGQAFFVFDADSTGLLSAAELDAALETEGLPGSGRELVHDWDTNANEMMDRNEFIKWNIHTLAVASFGGFDLPKVLRTG
jgi:Ca2+-binding EF-hand superfamily protein